MTNQLRPGGAIIAWDLPEKPAEGTPQVAATVASPRYVGGRLFLTPDNKFVLCKKGGVFRLDGTDAAGPVMPEYVQPENRNLLTDFTDFARVEPFLAAVFDTRSSSILLTTKDRGLKLYCYPGFTLLDSYQLAGIGNRAVLDQERGLLYVAAVDKPAPAEPPPKPKPERGAVKAREPYHDPLERSAGCRRHPYLRREEHPRIQGDRRSRVEAGGGHSDLGRREPAVAVARRRLAVLLGREGSKEDARSDASIPRGVRRPGGFVLKARPRRFACPATARLSMPAFRSIPGTPIATQAKARFW